MRTVTSHRGAHAKPRRNEGVNAMRGILTGVAVSIIAWLTIGGAVALSLTL